MPENQDQSQQTSQPDPNDVLRQVGYSSMEEWQKATYHSRNEGKRLADENAALKARMDEIERTVSHRSQYRDPAEELTSLGIPVDSLGAYIDSAVQRRIDPLVKSNMALNRVKAENPDFTRFEGEWQQWLNANPETNRRLLDAITRDPDNADFAIKGVFSDFERTQSKKQTREPRQSDFPTDAALPVKQGAGGGRGTEQFSQVSPEQVAKLLELARRGDDRAKTALIRLRLGNQPHPDLPPSA